MLGQHCSIDAGFVVETLEVGGTAQLHEIAVTFAVLGQEGEMIRPIVFAGFLVEHSALRYIQLAADEWLDTVLLATLVKLDCSRHDAVVGHSDGRLVHCLGLLDHGVDAIATV
jgi:hypothetical protein